MAAGGNGWSIGTKIQTETLPQMTVRGFTCAECQDHYRVCEDHPGRPWWRGRLQVRRPECRARPAMIRRAASDRGCRPTSGRDATSTESRRKSRREPCRLKSRLFVAVPTAVERGPISKWKTDRFGMGHKPMCARRWRRIKGKRRPICDLASSRETKG